MKRRNIFFFSFFIGLVLLGLICVQLYWIGNAIKLTQQHFEQDVNDGLNDVVTRFDKVSTLAKLTQKFNFRKQAIRWLSPKQESTAHGTKFLKDTMGEHSSYSIHGNQYNVKILEELTTDSNGVNTSRIQRTYNALDSTRDDNLEPGIKFNSRNSIVGTDSIDKKLQMLMGRSDVMNEIFDELVSINVYNDVNPHIDTVQLDSLIHSALSDRNIIVPYRFGLLNATQDTIIAASKGATSAELMKSSFMVNLMPKNVFMHPRYLSLYFPNETNHILYTLRFILLTSLILITIVIGAFYYTISTIFRQKKLSEIKSDFINNMTHEFKTPISTISLASEVLGDASIEKSAEKSQSYLQIIRNENKRLGSLVETILQAAILDKGELKLNIQETDVHQVIADVVQSMRLQIQNKNGKVTMNLNAQRYSLFADRMHIGNIIYNLLDNAIKYCRVEPQIIITTESTAEGLTLSVQDNGIGISKEDQKKIFETFYRVPTGNVHNVKGFGLGLSYVKAVAEKHGGHAEVESEPGNGSTFIVYLPFQNNFQ
ncbi:MAG TPA: HAMP domain-containing sensor histidine kinase [Bacteroidia bacterium]|jgi:two-component system phosphate regulon sensor histidine kinase PhoR|nr:HAMP domain-containing sensor histidine kinase [Bacteroidia bacterium]